MHIRLDGLGVGYLYEIGERGIWINEIFGHI
jgi:hypothetical protein